MNSSLVALQTKQMPEPKRPEFSLIKNDNEDKAAIYKLARIVFAETQASSLLAVESLCAMVCNLCVSTGRNIKDIVTDESIFESLSKKSARHQDLLIDSNSSAFQMCLRTVKRMLSGQLQNQIMNATKFHRVENLPDWAVPLGYVAEVDGLLFYL